MNYYTSTHQIGQLTLSETEWLNTTHNRHIYHVLLSHNLIWGEEIESTINSILMPQTPQTHDVMQDASNYWRGLSQSINAAHDTHIAALNCHEPNDGSFDKLPMSILAVK